MTTTQEIATKNSNAGRTVATVLVSMAGLFGALVAIAGLALVGVHAFARDAGGYYTTDTERLNSARYAVSSDAIELGPQSAGFDADDLGASLKVTAEPVNGKPVFVGIAARDDVDQYLGGVGPQPGRRLRRRLSPLHAGSRPRA